MVRIDLKTLQDLEFPSVLQQIADNCITEPGTERVLKIRPFKETNKITPELYRVKEFTASFESDSPIPNHDFEPINKAVGLLSEGNQGWQRKCSNT